MRQLPAHATIDCRAAAIIDLVAVRAKQRHASARPVLLAVEGANPVAGAGPTCDPSFFRFFNPALMVGG